MQVIHPRLFIGFCHLIVSDVILLMHNNIISRGVGSKKKVRAYQLTRLSSVIISSERVRARPASWKYLILGVLRLSETLKQCSYSKV